MAKQLGEKDLNNVSRQQMRSRAEDYLLGQAADTLQQQAQELLSPLGTARLSLKMTGEGLYRQQRAVIQPAVRRRRIADLQPDRLAAAKRWGAGQFALGQRWIVGDWLLGYNTALDSDFARQRNRGSVGAEAWGDYLRFSTNYYYPLSALSQQPGNGVFSAARRAVTTSRRKAICRFTARSAVRSAMSSTWATMSICSAAVKAKRSARHAAGAQLHPGTAGDDEGAA